MVKGMTDNWWIYVLYGDWLTGWLTGGMRIKLAWVNSLVCSYSVRLLVCIYVSVCIWVVGPIVWITVVVSTGVMVCKLWIVAWSASVERPRERVLGPWESMPRKKSCYVWFILFRPGDFSNHHYSHLVMYSLSLDFWRPEYLHRGRCI